ncbi:MAG: flexitail domain-containing putative surface protein [Dehalococcoidia bacterium]
MSDEKRVAGITGQDGGPSVEVDGTVYWNFGDTVLADGGIIPNTIGMSTDLDASDCVSLTPKTKDGKVVPLIEKVPGERTVWPVGMVETSPGRVRVYYTSIVSDPETTWRSQGIGLASFDTDTLTASRELGGELLWSEKTGFWVPIVRTYADETYVYVFLTEAEGWATDTILGRVPKVAVNAPANYEYWDPGEAGADGHWISGLWNEETGEWNAAVHDVGSLWRQPALHNGIDVDYNEFLGRWVAVYSANFLTSLSLRTAPDLTGPWDASDTVGVRCETFHPPPHRLFVCYSAAQHPYYATDGGRTIYVSYSNSDSYQVHLHELRLAALITQRSDPSGHTIYLPEGTVAPDGYSPDGAAFYASDIPIPGFAAIHRWQNATTGAIRYGAKALDGYKDIGVDFYAPVDIETAAATNALYAPVYRWSRDGDERYSPLNLAPAGYAPAEIAFYAACPDSNGDGLTDCAYSFAAMPLDSVDTDDDGCTDAREVTAPPQMGGQRNPLSYWDFFDTPNATNLHDGVVNVADIRRVLTRFGSRGNPGVSPLVGPIPGANDYHPAFDRGGRAGTQAWSLKGADGGINLTDVMAVIAQFGHQCTP